MTSAFFPSKTLAPALACLLAIAVSCAPSRQSKPAATVATTTNSAKNEEDPIIAPKGGSYQPEATRFFDLKHTRLELEPRWEQEELKGMAMLVIEPHFYPQNRVVIDAKNMAINSVVRVHGKLRKPLKFTYDTLQIKAQLDSVVVRGRSCTLEIDYVAKPRMALNKQLEAITDDKGLYFINPRNTVPGKTRMMWTQGEPESASCWFPTFDSPNQKSTQELQVTVDTAMTTLSNGTLVYQTKLAGGRRTDVWEMKQAHSPYLFDLVIAPFAVVKDKWRDKEVSYYVEKPYRNNARAIFGRTPEMIEFFSKRLGVDYVWPKYSQAIVRDYVSGAMENTTATIHMEELLLDQRTLADYNWDQIVAHELFHHWFGDLATCESWANLSLNESFANYSEYLWAEYKAGLDEADIIAEQEKQQYLYESNTKQEPLIRYRHATPNDMFDSHSYAKGGRILHMLRKDLGDDAFFAGCQLYLKRFSYKKAEAHDLRLCFEEITGRDLNYFFDQWYFKPGHPQLRVRKTFTGEEVLLSVLQVQDTTYTPIYTLPITVDVWNGINKERYTFRMHRRDTTFTLPAAGQRQPSLVQFDPENVLLAEVSFDQQKDELVHQFNYAPRALHRLRGLLNIVNEAPALELNGYLKKALKDSSYMVRQAVMQLALNPNFDIDDANRASIMRLANSDPKASVREAAIGASAQLKIAGFEQVLIAGMKDYSYAVQAEALNQYIQTKPKDGDERLKEVENATSRALLTNVAELYGAGGQAQAYSFFERNLFNMDQTVQAAVIKCLGEWTSHVSGNQKEQGLALLEKMSAYAFESKNIARGLRAGVRFLKSEPRAKAISDKIAQAVK